MIFPPELTAQHSFSMSVPGREGIEHFSQDRLVATAQSVAAYVAATCPEKSSIVLAFGSGAAFTAAFLGCVQAKMLPFAIKPTTGPRPSEMLSAQIKDAAPRLVVTERHRVDDMRQQTGHQIPVIAVEDIPPATLQSTVAANDDVAFLQYSSGSTANPKGIAVTHGNLRANLTMLADCVGAKEGETHVSWLPHYHDMGLVATQLLSVFVGMHLVQLDSKHFLTHPLNWLKTISDHKAVLSGVPNFAFDVCAQKADPKALNGLDLSCIRTLYAGADNVQAKSLRQFEAAFKPYGLSDTALLPGYGLAEATVFVSGIGHAARWSRVFVDDAALQAGDVVITPNVDTSMEVVACGKVPADQGICIADPETGKRAAPDRVGEIWVRGDHTVQAYLNKPELSASQLSTTLYPDGGSGWLRTGDLGFIHAGLLYPTGRIKDLIVLNGRNISASEVELPASALFPIPASAAFVTTTSLGDAQIELVAGCSEPAKASEIGEALWEETNALLQKRFNTHLGALSLVPRRQVPKTSSGKVQRDLCRRRLKAGTLDVLWRKERPVTPPITDAIPSTGAPPSDYLPVLRQLVAPFLANPDIPDTQDLTAAGMDSLLMVRFVLSVEQTVGHNSFVRSFLATPTLSHLATLLANSPSSATKLDTKLTRERPITVYRKINRTLRTLAIATIPYGIASRALHLGFLTHFPAGPYMRTVAKNTTQLLSEAGSKTDLAAAKRHNQIANFAPDWRLKSLKKTRNSEKFIKVQGLDAIREKADGRGIVFVGTHSRLLRALPFAPELRSKPWAAIGNYEPEGERTLVAPDEATRPKARAEQIWRATQTLNAGGYAMIFADGNEGQGGIKVNLHGRERLFRQGFAELAFAGNALIVHVASSISGTGLVTFHLSSPIDLNGKRDLIEPALRLYIHNLNTIWEQEISSLNGYGQNLHLSASKW
ncbi:AMP-binding protein [Planktotalea sp.]|uniref:AMP-binding protein n=1 Tax=Planktotalea sp. TaxID=2029877 RepID=UPI003297C99C